METTIKIEDIVLDYINTKVDKYENKQSYFKVTKQVSKNKIKKLSNKLVGVIPFWTSENGDTMIRIKSKHIPLELKSGVSYKCNLELNFFDLKVQSLTGYYLKVLNGTPTKDIDDAGPTGSLES